MELNSLTRSINLPTVPLTTVNPVANNEVQEKVAETAKVTPPPSTGDSNSQGGSPSEPGLGQRMDVYAKNAPPLLGTDPNSPPVGDYSLDPKFPFLVPLGPKPDDGMPGKIFNAVI
jgi:hypothetical protein